MGELDFFLVVVGWGGSPCDWPPRFLLSPVGVRPLIPTERSSPLFLFFFLLGIVPVGVTYTGVLVGVDLDASVVSNGITLVRIHCRCTVYRIDVRTVVVVQYRRRRYSRRNSYREQLITDVEDVLS